MGQNPLRVFESGVDGMALAHLVIPAQLNGGTPYGSSRWIAAAMLIFLLASGCDGRQSTAQRLEEAYKSAGMNPVTVYPLSGTITVDGDRPISKSETTRLVVIAYDGSKADGKAKTNAYAFVKPDGSFELPPLAPGKYVMLFAQLGHNPRMGFYGPDGLNNLYNDPDVNSKKTEFLIDHRAPGRTDYAFNLSVAGETPPRAPGPKAFVGSGPVEKAGRRAAAQK